MSQEQLPYLEERKLVKRWRGPIPALMNLAFTLLIFAVTWWIFQDPRGIMRFYTPYVGYNYCRWWLIILIWMAYTFDFWPFKKDWIRNAHPLQKGLVLALISVGTMIFFIHGFFEAVLGNFAFAYFNPEHLQKLGLTEFYSTEYAAQACMMFAVIASWISPAWVVALEGQPWANASQPVRGFSIWLGTFCLSLVIYFMTMHNHMGILYYPWQYFTAICPPYWEDFAQTVSANFHVAWIMCCTVVVWFVEGIWERYPFTMIKRDWPRRIALFVGIIVIAWALCLFFWYMQELVWGDAIRGHRRDAAPDWRWLHVGETAIFFLVPALFVQFYCENWPTRFSTPVNILIRTGLVIVGGIGFMVILDVGRCRGNFRKMSFHTKVVLSTTAVLLFGGMALLQLTDGLGWMTAFFQSMTARTAGFSTISEIRNTPSAISSPFTMPYLLVRSAGTSITPTTGMLYFSAV